MVTALQPHTRGQFAARDAALSPEHWTVLRQQAEILVKTGFLPAEIKTAEQAIAICLKGAELGVPPMYALSNIHVIKGKPTCSAELMLALVKRDHGRDAVHVTETTAEQCTVTYRDGSHRGSYTFTIQDAKRAGLSGGNWTGYPAAMLRARCISAVARMAFPDSIGGMYTPDEVGAVVDVETGEVLGELPEYGLGDVELPPPNRRIFQHEAIPLADAPPAGDGSELGPTAQQITKIWAVAKRELGYDDALVHRLAWDMFEVDSLKKLTRRQASDFIEALTTRAAGQKPEPLPMSVDDLYPKD